MEELKRLSRDEFPPLLHEIPDQPKQLYVRGSLPDWQRYKLLAVVGSRAMTSYGKRAVSELILGLKGYPVLIVSGLAYGVDAAAHRAALDAGLTTIAVPGSGLEWPVVYPKANVALARDIVAQGGMMLSEFEPTQKAADYTFPQRNRIMAGMCHATLVIEAKERSGSLITARLTSEYNRELLVVPGSIFSDESRGCHQFLKLGATLVTDTTDILEALGLSAEAQKVTHTNNPIFAALLEHLTEPLSIDDLSARASLPTHELLTIISAMELEGLVVYDGLTVDRA